MFLGETPKTLKDKNVWPDITFGYIDDEIYFDLSARH